MKLQWLIFSWLIGGLSGCAMLENLPKLPGAVARVQPPTITYQGAELVQTPSHRALAAYYCPSVANLPLGTSGAVCRGFFGPPPGLDQLVVGFDLRFKISNPNRIPIPLASILAAATVFPTATNQALGAVCTQLCPDGQCGASDPNACQASTQDIRSLNDFAGAAANFLIMQGLAMAAGQAPTFVAPKVSAESELDVIVRFSFGPQALLGVMKQLAIQSSEQLRKGNMPTFQIPFKLEGTVFFDVGSFGRVAVGYGPVQGIWQLPTGGLTPPANISPAMSAPPPVPKSPVSGAPPAL